MRESGGRGVAVVTGGTGALGRWVCAALAEAGYRVHVPWVVEGEAEALGDFLGERRSALHLLRADVTEPGSVERFFGEVQERGGRLDVLCNLAGGFRMAPVEETEPGVWDHLMGLNAGSAFLCCRSAVPLLRASGGGSIVNVAALPAVDRGASGMSAYAASKAAVLNLTYSLARELRPAGIRVNAVAPETLDTPANRQGMPDADPTRWVHPREAARVIQFLAGPDSVVVTGSVLALAGVG
jgi:NAD(P)-dependent dehydrogenase (short-subunit alcohol dehydrogenase family)